MQIKQHKKEIVYAMVFMLIGYLVWVNSSDGVVTSNDSAILNVFPGGAEYKNYELNGQIDIENKVPYFGKPYKNYSIKRASFGDIGDYLEFDNCNIHSRTESAICRAHDCNNAKSVQNMIDNKPLDVDLLLNQCSEKFKDWRVSIKSV